MPFPIGVPTVCDCAVILPLPEKETFNPLFSKMQMASSIDIPFTLGMVLALSIFNLVIDFLFELSFLNNAYSQSSWKSNFNLKRCINSFTWLDELIMLGKG